MWRKLRLLASAVSLLLCVAVCVLWVRARTGSDQVAWEYNRYLPDRSAASDQIDVISDKRLWLQVAWGSVGPYNGQLVWGYYLNADRSGGRPRLTFRHDAAVPSPTWFTVDPDDGTSGFGPVRWQGFQRSANGERFRFVRVGVSHWLLALLLIVPPALALHRWRASRRARRIGLCRACGYDLRATPDRCPECGRLPLGRTPHDCTGELVVRPS